MVYQPAVLGTARLNNFRLNYLTPDLIRDRPVHTWMVIGGIDVTKPGAPMRVLYKSLTIRDVLFDTPNTCAFTLLGAAPTVGQPIAIWINSNAPQLLFNGELQTVNTTYKGQPSTVVHPVTAIDDTARANRRRPLMPFVNVSATTIAQTLISTYAPGFSSAGVEAGLPAVTINFDGSEGGMKGCLTALAKLIGGYWYFENKTLYFFVTPPAGAPDPIDETPGRFLHEPAITWAIDKSQVRTRVYGKGASTQLAATVDPSVTIVPVDDIAMFTASGGQAIAGVTPDGAASRILRYTGVQLGGGGGLVGPGALPSAPPGLALAAGPGVDSGVHDYAVTFLTAAGQSLPGPVASITVGAVPAPVTAPTPGTPTTGGAVDPGTHRYVVTFVTASGETTGGPASASVTTSVPAPLPPPPSPGPGNISAANSSLPNNLTINAYYAWVYTFVRSADGAETTPSVVSASYFNSAVNAANAYVPAKTLAFAAVPPPGYVLQWYRSKAAVDDPTALAAPKYRVVTGYRIAFGEFQDGGADAALGPLAPTVPNPGGLSYQTVPLTTIPIGPALVTARRLYRERAGWWYLVATIANNTATTFTDTLADASLGAGMPSSNTAVANQVLVTLPIGGAGVIGRSVFRSTAGSHALHFLGVVNDNTTTIFGPDTNPDSAIAGNPPPPTVDNSGLKQPEGQILPGATSIIVASAEPFPAVGGWAVIGNGAQVVRYTGKTANTLTGVPATGVGSVTAAVSYNSTITAASALLGVTGILETMIAGSPIHVWVQRDDVAAQAYMASLDGGGDGIYEHIWSDERRSEASLIQVCDAQLELYSRPLVTVTYASRDLKTKSGKTVQIALATPAIAEALTIQDVQIAELGIRGLAPKFTVTASSVRQSLENVLQMLIRKADA